MNAFKAPGTRYVYRYQEGKGLQGDESWQAVLTHDAMLCWCGVSENDSRRAGGGSDCLNVGAFDISTLRHGQALADQRLGK